MSTVMTAMSSTKIDFAVVDPGVGIMRKANAGMQNHVRCFEETKERIRKLFNSVELSVSAYDTAWVGMVPSPYSSQAPCFPGCINWLLDNQLYDGSWGLCNRHPLLLKDALSSTLASILALKQWGVGQEQIDKGLHFIQLNIASATDKNQYSPIGFDIIFPGMLERAAHLDLNLPLEPKDMDAILQNRDLELRRCYKDYSKEKAYLAYISEGMVRSQDWDMVMKYQRKNGSLFNSPSTTAAAFTRLQSAGCLNYLHSLLEKHGNAVPTVYPLDIYTRLCMVDNLERLGINHHFWEEIRTVLDETYRCWLQVDEEIFMDVATCALAFRLLRSNGYSVSSDPLIECINEDLYISSLGGHLKGIIAALELYRASQIVIHPDESGLEKQNAWSSHCLKQKLSNGSIGSDGFDSYISEEVYDALKFPFHADLERLASRRNIEHYNVDSTRILKTSYCSSNISNKHFLKLAVEDFNICQSIHRKELKHLERWAAENRLDKLKFARQKLAYCYFSAAATLSSPELSDARISWAKNGVLTTVVDDFFDIEGSIEELVNLIHLVEKWDANLASNCCSEHVRIIFSALQSTICEIGSKASAFQARSVTSHIIHIWLDLLNAMLREAKWVQEMSVPTMDEYMTNGYVSFALGPIVLPALYFVGPRLTEEVVHSAEVHKLYKLMSTCGRLLNDIQGFERESKDGKLNAISLRMIHSNGVITEEEAIKLMKNFINGQRRELLGLVLQGKDSIVPGVCKGLFWKMCKVVHLFYMEDDGFTSDEKIRDFQALINIPVNLEDLKVS